MRFIKQFENYHEKDQISEGLSYHVKNSIPLMESVYRIESDAWISLINEARDMWEREVLDLCEDDLFLISTDAGKFGIFEGKKRFF
jgi:hypothetical protein